MAKRLLLNVLVSVLGDYIEDLTEDNLKLGVWSGEIVLNDLRINRKILQKLGLPVSIVHGAVTSLTVIIPWASLETNPVRILADGVYLQVNQLNVADMNGEFMMKRAIEMKRFKLDEADKLVKGSLGGEVSEKDLSYFQRLTATIVDNLEIQLTNLHFRYEDDQLLPDVCFSAGVTLDSFSLKTRDQSWKEAFVARPKTKEAREAASVYKMASLENLGIYWNTNSLAISGMERDAWRRAMHGMIFKEGASPSGEFEYVLATPNVLTVKVVHTERATESMPRLDVIVEDTTLLMNIDRVQFLQFVATADRLLELNGLIKLFALRPRRRPMQDPRAWWRYAAKLVLRRETLLENVASVLEVARVRPRYLSLLRALNRREDFAAGPLTMSEEDELFDIESQTPLCALLVLRSIASTEAREAREAVRALVVDASPKDAPNDSGGGGGGFLGLGWGHRSASSAEVGDVSFESLREDLGRREFTELASNAVAFRMRVKAKLTLNLFVVEQPIATAVLGLALTTSVQSEARSVSFSVDQLYVTDRFSKGATIKHLLAVQRDVKRHRESAHDAETGKTSSNNNGNNDDDNKGYETCFSVLFNNVDNHSTVKISALPLEIALNEPCIKQLMFFFSKPEHMNGGSNPDRAQSAHASQSQGGVHKKKNISKRTGGGTTVTFEVAAPKIIVPEDDGPDSGFLLLDCGFLDVRGSTGQGKTAWDVSLRQVNAGMPRTVRDMYTFAEQQLYLIKPFDIGVTVSKNEKLSDTMSVDVHILPELRGELDASKLYRLLRCVKVAIRCFTQQPDAITDAPPVRNRSRSEDRTVLERTVDQLTTPRPAKTPRRARHSVSATSSKLDACPPVLSDAENNRIKMCLDIKVPVLALDLYYSSNSTNYVYFSMDNLTVKMRFRPLDSQIGLYFSCMSIADTARPQGQPLLRTLEEDRDEQQITYTSISSRQSPLFVGHGSEVNVTFAHLLMNADVETFGHVQPFVQAALGYGPEAIQAALQQALFTGATVPVPPGPRAPSTPVRSTAIRASSTSAPRAPPVPLPEKPNGLRVFCDFKRTSFNFMKLEQVPAQARAAPATPSDTGTTPVEMFSLRVLRLVVDIDMRELMCIHATFATLAFVDIRDYHSDYVFKTILAARVNGDTSDSTMGHAPKIVSIDTADEPDEHFLTLAYDQLTSGTSTVEVNIKACVVYVSLDTILELISVTVDNSLAFLALFQRPQALRDAHDRAEIIALAAAMRREYEGSYEYEYVDPATPGCLPKIVKTSTINVRVSVAEPKVVLLQDPTSSDSRALVGGVKALEVTYQRDVGMGEDFRQVHESLLVSITSLETFVVLQMGRWLPQQVLEPLGVDLQLSRRFENDRKLAHTLKLDVDQIEGRLSLNDLALLQAILLQRALVRPSAPSPAKHGEEEEKNDAVARTSVSVPTTPVDVPPCMYTYALSLGPVKAILINDFNRQNLPVLQVLVDKGAFNGRGTDTDFSGKGSMIMNLDFYNPKALFWEPIVDRWKPQLAVEADGPELSYKVFSEYTLQCSITGAMLESLLQTYSLLTRHEDADGREQAPAVLVRNMLGVSICLRDSVTGQLVVDLGPTESSPLLPVAGTFATAGAAKSGSGRSHTRGGARARPGLHTDKYSGSVNLHLTGDLASKREPLYHLPTKMASAMLFTLSSAVAAAGGEKEDSAAADSAAADILLDGGADDDPVLEEVFQNHRWDPIKGTWVLPYLVGDPPEFCNIRAEAQRLNETVLPSDNWRWQGDWEPEQTCKVGTEMDEAGWYYDTTFGNFVRDKPRHTHRNLDCVRRRRWTRLRIPRSPPLGDPAQSLPLFWEVQTHSSGSRVICVHSPVLLKNSLPFPIMVSLCNEAWPTTFEYGPIEEDATFAFPLLQANATEFRVRPFHGGCEDGGEYEWSDKQPCVVHSHNYTKGSEAMCTGTGAGTRGEGGGRPSDAHIRLLWKCDNRCLTISCLPHVVLNNKLPCSLQYKFTSGGGSSRAAEESGQIAPGTHFKLARVSYRHSLAMSFKVGSHGWSAIKYVDVSKDSRVNIDLPLSSGHTGLVLTASVRKSRTSVELEVYSRLAVLDRTGLNLSFLSRRSPGVDILRRTEFGATGAGAELADAGAGAGPGAELVAPVGLSSSGGSNWVIGSAALNIPVHVDAPARTWSHLPAHLLGQTYMSCHHGAHVFFASKQSLQFTVPVSCVVVLAFEPLTRSAKKGAVGEGAAEAAGVGVGGKKRKKAEAGLPKWVTEEQGFHRMDDDNVASTRTQGRTHDDVFASFGKFYGAGERVVLGDKARADAAMYSVFLASPCHAVLSQVIMDDAAKLAEADRNWADGGDGMGLIFSDDAQFAVGLHAGEEWSEELTLDESQLIPHAKNSFDVRSGTSRAEHLLAYKVSPMPGAFSRTRLITVMPRYCIINCVNEPIYLCQDGRGKSFMTVPPFSTRGWHKDDYSLGSKVHMRIKSTQWCLAGMDINEIGSLSVLLPTLGEAASQVLHVEVKIAEPGHDCLVAVLVWRATNDTTAGIGIENETDRSIVVRQAGIDLTGTGHNPDHFVVCLQPHSWTPFGWADPEEAAIAEMAVGTSFVGTSGRRAKLDVTKVDSLLRLPVAQGSYDEVQLAVEASSYGRLIRITAPQPVEATGGGGGAHHTDGLAKPQRAHKISVQLVSLGISLILERPFRREFLSAYLDDVGLSLHKLGERQSFEFRVGGLQVDNYSEAAVYPACLYSSRDDRRTRLSDRERHDGMSAPVHSFLQLVVVRERPSDRSAKIFKYVALRMLEVTVEMDSSTIKLLQMDLLNDLKIVSRDEALGASVPAVWIGDLNRTLMQPLRRTELHDMNRLMRSALSSKMYIESLIVHPIKLTITVIQTPFPRKLSGEEGVSSTAMNLLTTLAGVERMQLKLFSFIVSSAMESPQSLWQRIAAKSWQDLQFQLAKVAGSLRVIGAPMGLARNIGNGLQAFLYEPIQGAMESPADMILGIGKGTTSLVGGVVAGALNSTAAIVNTASNGLSFLTGDDDFVRSRAALRQRSNATRGGALSGIVEGGESIVTGLSSGIAGLFLKPWEEAQQDGARGFFRGLGMGLVGAAVKPVLGITDGFTAVAQGVSTEVGGVQTRARVRPPRALDRSPTDPAALVLCPLDIQAAHALEFVQTRAKEHSFQDAFVKYVNLGAGRYVILSEKYLYWKRSSSGGSGIWGRVWAEVSHMAFGDGNARSGRHGVKLALYDRGTRPQSRSAAADSGVFIETTTRRQAVALYQALADNASRLGNPTKVLPVEIATEGGGAGSASGSRGTGATSPIATNEDNNENNTNYNAEPRFRPTGPANEFEGHFFGSFNGRGLDPPAPDTTESNLLLQTQDVLGSARDNATLDLELWRLVFSWKYLHTGMGASRACALLVLNRSHSAVRLSSLQLLHGRDARVLGAQQGGYDLRNRRVLPGGSFTVFAVAHPASPLEPGHLRFDLRTTAFAATIGSQLNEASCTSLQGFTVGFLEKTVSDWWARYVLVMV